MKNKVMLIIVAVLLAALAVCVLIATIKAGGAWWVFGVINFLLEGYGVYKICTHITTKK